MVTASYKVTDNRIAYDPANLGVCAVSLLFSPGIELTRRVWQNRALRCSAAPDRVRFPAVLFDENSSEI